MPEDDRPIRIATHGGAHSNPDHSDGAEAAAQRALEVLLAGEDVLDAACAAVVVLEDDVRFNAGTGSSIRMDGSTIQMDAACMDDRNHLGAVAVIDGVRNPILVARQVCETPHVLLAGGGATAFARRHGHEAYDATTDEARAKYAKVRAFLAGEAPPHRASGWRRDEVARHWNFERRRSEVIGSADTVGAVVQHGPHFAAALSTGGPTVALRGRVGDVPLPGCGLFASRYGAVAATGDGEVIAKNVLAYRVHELIAQGTGPEDAIAEGLSWFSDSVEVGLIVVSPAGVETGANRPMAAATLSK